MQASPREIISLWKSVNPRAHVRVFADDVGVKKFTANGWIQRGSIRPKHWPRIIRAANKRGFPITWENLAGQAPLLVLPKQERAA